MSAVSPDILRQLRDIFEVVIPGDREIGVKCPMCKKRGMGEDGSGRSAPGHLFLNFDKNVGFCVRCGYGVGNLRRWLRNFHLDMPDTGFADPRKEKEKLGFEAEELLAVKLLPQVLRVPDECRFIDSGDETSWPFAESLFEKNLNWEQIERHNLQYAVSGKLAGYVMFPFIEDEEFVYYQGRATWKELTDNPKKSKYNPDEHEAPLGKNAWLYGVDDAVIGGEMYLCEGTLDRISLHDFVREHRGPDAYACSLQGTSVGMPKPGIHPLNTQFGKIAVLQPRVIGVIFDGPKHRTDPGAYGKAKAVADELSECGFNAYAYRLPFGDPNELAFHHDILAMATTPPDEAGGADWAHQISLAFDNANLLPLANPSSYDPNRQKERRRHGAPRPPKRP